MRIGFIPLALALVLAGAARAEEEKKGASFAAVPGPFYNPNQGLGVMAMGMMMFHPSQDSSPPSVVGLMGMGAVLPPFGDAGDRYSWATGTFGRFFLDDDRWRVIGAIMYFDLFREFHGIGGDPSADALFGYRQNGLVAIAQVLREVVIRHLYLGFLAGYTTTRSVAGDPASQAVLDSVGGGADWLGTPNFGLLAQYDEKDNQYYPTSGIDLNVRFNGSFKSGQAYQVLVPSIAQYFSLSGGDKLVLAWKAFGQFGFGELPLSSYAYYGSRGTTLGYATGEYVDKMMAGVEAELRWLFWKRFGAEGGLGIGKVFPSFDQFGPQPWLPGGWGSLTYKLMEKMDMRARMTAAVSKTGAALYFAVGQNF